jgi:hypothetical protein
LRRRERRRRRRPRPRRPRGLHYFLAAKTMIVTKGDKEGESRESRQERCKSIRTTGVNTRQYGWCEPLNTINNFQSDG